MFAFENKSFVVVREQGFRKSFGIGAVHTKACLILKCF